MTRQITRRDFINGIAIGAGGVVLQGCGSDSEPAAKISIGAPTVFNPPDSSAYYPPTLTGMRGSHEGSFEVAHDLAWRGHKPDQYQTLNEHYDLVVVGAGMSGLAAALFYRKKMGPDARILLLDNHDDFGGHAKRNEFHQDGRMMLSLGGAQNIEALSGYSEAARGLMTDIGVDDDFMKLMGRRTPKDQFLAGKLDADNGVAVPGPDGHITVGGNWLAAMFGGKDHEKSVRALPLPADQQDKLIDFFAGNRDFLDDLSLSEKWDYVNSTSYNRYLVDKVGLAEDTLPILNVLIIHLTGVSGWNLTVLEGMTMGGTGIKSMGWVGKATANVAETLLDSLLDVQMFPDGNASIARLLVQKLIPAVAPDMQGPQDVVISRFDYSALDRENNATRLRLNSTVVGVRDNGNDQVEVDYVQQGDALRVTADHCVLACYNALIPHLCPEMPEAQKEGLSYGVKTPFVYANVQLDNGQAFSKLGPTLFQCPYDPFQWVSTSPAIHVGGYEPPRGPDDPMVMFMMHSPMTEPEQPMSCRDQLRMGRHKIYNTSFADYEQQIREQLQSMLGKHGFNHETDIRAITVNRIPHGYAYAYLGLYDPEWEEGQAPHEVGRAQFGRISIANTDSEATALMNLAFDAAWRAVEEQTV
ncbi:MAG: Tat pathway signal protein [Gammaproteobacteria bacterium]|nr:Tat pathway signal protein [Gammaproteobacteria bacterium]